MNSIKFISVCAWILSVCVGNISAQTIGSNYKSGDFNQKFSLQQSIGQPYGVFQTVSEPSIQLNQGHILPNNGKMEFPELHVQIFPNPVVEYIHIKTSNYETIRSINIFDLNGRCMYSDNYSSPKTIQPIGLNQLSPGVYLVQVIDQYQNTQTVKITKTSIPK